MSLSIENKISVPDWKKYEFKCILDHSNQFPDYKVYHWDSVPDDILYKINFFTNFTNVRHQRLKDFKSRKEFGLDGVAVKYNENGEIITVHGIQCKLWKMFKVGIDDLKTFFKILSQMKNKNHTTGYLYYCGELTNELKTLISSDDTLIGLQLQPDYCTFFEDLSQMPMKESYETRDYQVEALNCLENAFLNKNNNTPIMLNMPCGTGKTHISSTFFKNNISKFDIFFVLSPTKMLTLQNLNNYKNILNIDYILIDSDYNESSTRDFNKILNLMIMKNKLLVSVTYRSFEDMIRNNKIMNYIKSKQVIYSVDEAHNIAPKKNIINSLMQFKNVLLLTATPSARLNEEFKFNIGYKMLLSQAIDKNCVVDYQIYLPVEFINSIAFHSEQENEDYDGDPIANMNALENIYIPSELAEMKSMPTDSMLLIKKGLFISNGMIKSGSRRCIVYCKNINECEIFKVILLNVMEKYHGWSTKVYIITNKTNENERKLIRNEFQSYENGNYVIQYLLSVKVLDEGIDIPQCDSVFISHTSDQSNCLRVMQRMCRANRIDLLNKTKIACCFVWTDDESSTGSFLREIAMSERIFFDFAKKIKPLNTNYDKNNEMLEYIQNFTTSKEFNLLKSWLFIKCMSMKELFNIKCELFKNYAIKNGVPKDRLILKNTKIGTFQIGQWYTSNRRKSVKLPDTYKEVKSFFINCCDAIKDDYLRYEKQINECTDDKLTVSDKCEIVRNFINENGTVPAKNTVIDGVQIGRFYQYHRNFALKNNSESKSFAEIRNQLIQSCPIVKLDYDRQEEHFKSSSEKKDYSQIEKCDFLILYIEKHKINNKVKFPKLSGEFYEGFNIGCWLNDFFRRMKTDLKSNSYKNDECYKYLTKHLPEIIEEKVNAIRKVKASKPSVSEDEYFALLVKYIIKFKKTPPDSFKIDNKRLGGWFSDQKRNIWNNYSKINESNSMYNRLCALDVNFKDLNGNIIHIIKPSLDKFIKDHLNKLKK